jgi:hypothetical protein
LCRTADHQNDLLLKLFAGDSEKGCKTCLKNTIFFPRPKAVRPAFPKSCSRESNQVTLVGLADFLYLIEKNDFYLSGVRSTAPSENGDVK